jgi:hypothetical protein
MALSYFLIFVMQVSGNRVFHDRSALSVQVWHFNDQQNGGGSVWRSVFLEAPTEEEWLDIAAGFKRDANFPHCVGAIDGKHIRIIKPSNTGSFYYNYKNYFSLVLLAVCDSNYMFRAVDIGVYRC